MSQFIAYHVSDYLFENGEPKTVPIACAETRKEAQSLAIRMVLGMCVLEGSISVCERPDISEDDFHKLKGILETVAVEKGILPEVAA